MKLPLSWIQEFIDINAPPSQIAKLLTHAGLEVESYALLPVGFSNVVIAEVTNVAKHPFAEEQLVATISNGSKIFQVVSKAQNCRKGIKTAFAPPGATITLNGDKLFEIEKTTIQGVESNGLLLSEKELGLGPDEQTIMEFKGHLKTGQDLAEIYSDTVFDISLTPNLGHCQSVTGIARELFAATEDPLTLPDIRVDEEGEAIQKKVVVEVLDHEKAPRYACRLIQGVKIGPSPGWMQKRLLASDVRPVNNVVDITNYVLLEMGHPLHSFDYDLIRGKKIVVRRAYPNETLLTLDGKTRSLITEDLLICDQERAIALAGVMGGQNAEVSSEAKNILLESALFEPKTCRKTCKRFGLQTEASKRFEKGCDPQNVLKALDRAAQLMKVIAGGTICKGVVDIYPKELIRKPVQCRLSRINKVLGTKLGLSEVEAIFSKLEMTYTWDGKDVFEVSAPSYRMDISEEVDLIEEVARIFGFENISLKKSYYCSSSISHSPIYLFENQIRRCFVGMGLQEFVTCDLVGPTLLNIVQESVLFQDEIVRVLNPTSVEQSQLRTSLLPALLQVAKYNYDHDVPDIRGFEIGKVHFKNKENYNEQPVAACLLMGTVEVLHWDERNKESDFFDLKGIIVSLLKELTGQVFCFKNRHLNIFHPGRQASICRDALELGSLGEVHPCILQRLDLPKRVYFAEFNLQDLLEVSKKDFTFKELPIFPQSKRDLTISVDNKVSFQKILDAIYSKPSDLLKKVDLIGVYRGEKVGKGKKNLTLRFVYRDDRKTVVHEVVDAEHAKLTSQIEAIIL